MIVEPIVLLILIALMLPGYVKRLEYVRYPFCLVCMVICGAGIYVYKCHFGGLGESPALMSMVGAALGLLVGAFLCNGFSQKSKSQAEKADPVEKK